MKSVVLGGYNEINDKNDRADSGKCTKRIKGFCLDGGERLRGETDEKQGGCGSRLRRSGEKVEMEHSFGKMFHTRDWKETESSTPGNNVPNVDRTVAKNGDFGYNSHK